MIGLPERGVIRTVIDGCEVELTVELRRTGSPHRPDGALAHRYVCIDLHAAGEVTGEFLRRLSRGCLQPLITEWSRQFLPAPPPNGASSLEVAAAAYQRAVVMHEPANEAVASALGVSRGTAIRRVRAARDAGLL